MAICPFANQRLLPENKTQSKIKPRIVILHTAVDSPGPTDLARYFARADVGAESHFYVWYDGRIDQMMDTNVRADANYKANDFAISIETEDEGKPDQLPWTPAQMDSLVKLTAWCCETHGIPKKKVETWNGAGIGYHSQFNDASGNTPWSIHDGKTCPGKVRRTQVPEVIRRVSGVVLVPEGGDDPVTDADIEKIANAVALKIVPKITGSQIGSINDKVTNLGDVVNNTNDKTGGIYNKLVEVLSAVNSLKK